ncbi:STAS domain-containing protein [Sediminibacillus massiliensis]|uniref:STAS domain-containing protein n=1 Tax=Sediminibacillus massiliensis TaxID=1926277 RepID=UPI001FE2C863|nr:STAS domain-containing protein [Sediminibacillus massiliensis]
MNSFHGFHTYLKNNANSLAHEIVETVMGIMDLNIPAWEQEQAVEMYVEFLGYLGESLGSEKNREVPDSLIEWSKKNAAMQVSSEGKISEIAVRYPPTREVFSDIFTRISSELGMSIHENALVIKRVNKLLDISLNETIYAFERLSDKYKEKTKKELAELSAPLVPVKDDVVVLPFIGEIDAYRANHIMENVVPQIAELEIDYVIADFSGILTINADTAQSLHQIGSMTKLMGVQVITTGLRPQLVQTVVNNSIEFKTIKAFATVKQALDSIEQDT